MAYRLVEHTADVAIEAEGPSREAALAEAAQGLLEVITGRPHPNAPLGIKSTTRPDAVPDQEIAFTVEAPDLAALAVAFLSEILWVLESKDLLWLGGGVTLHEQPAESTTHGPVHPIKLEARGNAVRYDPVLQGRGVEVKAVTYHDIAFEPREKHAGKGHPSQTEWHLRVVLDL